jgi:DNA-binding IclR family transcriptional regulator
MADGKGSLGLTTTRRGSPDAAPEAASRAPAVARVATILRLLAKERRGLGVNEIARKVDIVPSTCFHILRALVDEGFIAFDPDRKTYRTSVGLLSLVRDSLASGGFQQAVQPHLDRLASDYNLTAVAVELDNFDRMVVIAISRADSFVSLHVNVGSRFPALISATGRCFAAQSGLSKSELSERFKQLRWEKAPRFSDWYAQVERARDEGVAVDFGNYARGVTVLATLISKTNENATRGIALIGLEHHMTEKLLRTLREEILKTAAEVSTELS